MSVKPRHSFRKELGMHLYLSWPYQWRFFLPVWNILDLSWLKHQSITGIQREIAEAKKHESSPKYTRITSRLCSVDRSQWPCLPRPETICLYEPFAQHLDAALGTEVTATPYAVVLPLNASAIQQIPTYRQKWGHSYAGYCPLPSLMA